MDTIELQDHEYYAFNIPTPHSRILVIKGKKGLLACGYIDISTADKVGDAVAVVTGVDTYVEMMATQVVKVSKAARRLGIEVGMEGKEALKHMGGRLVR